MTREERAELRECRLRAPLNEWDVREAIEHVFAALCVRFTPWDALQKAVARLQDAAFWVLAASRGFPGMVGETWTERMCALLHADEMITTAPRPANVGWIDGPPEDDEDGGLEEDYSVAVGMVMEALNDNPDWITSCAKYLTTETRSTGRPGQPLHVDGQTQPGHYPTFLAALSALRAVTLETEAALAAFRLATETRNTIPGRVGPGRPWKIGRWTAAAITDILLRSDPSWSEAELAALFGALGRPELATRDAIHSLKAGFDLPRDDVPLADEPTPV